MTLKSSLKPQRETKRNGRAAALKREIIELANNKDDNDYADDDDDVEDDVQDDDDNVEDEPDEQLEWSAAQSLVQMNSKQEKQRCLGAVIMGAGAATGEGTGAGATGAGATGAAVTGATGAGATTTTTATAAAGRCNS